MQDWAILHSWLVIFEAVMMETEESFTQQFPAAIVTQTCDFWMGFVIPQVYKRFPLCH